MFFNSLPAEDPIFVSSERIEVTLPFDAGFEGTPSIRITDPERGETTRSDLLTVSYGEEVTFVRGDADSNGRLTISDAVTILRRFGLSDNTKEPPCLVALDVDDSGAINLSDTVFLLGHLFRTGSPPPPAPSPDCGVDPTPDAAMTCAGPTACP